MKKIPIWVAAAATLLAILASGYLVGSQAHAATPLVSDDAVRDAPLSTTTVEALIHYAAAFYGVDYAQLYGTLKCESSVHGIPFDTNAIGDAGTSFGIAQIHLSSHPDVSKVQAMDGLWSIYWTAKEFHAGRAWQWTCWRIKYKATN